MKKILSAFLLIFVFLNCEAMMKPRKFFVKNAFPEKIEVYYQLQRQSKQQPLLLTSGEIKEIPGWETITKLAIVPYGEWKRMGTKESVGFQPSDYLSNLSQAASINPEGDLLMLIESGATYVPAFAKSTLEKIAPYKVTIASYFGKEHEAQVPESYLLKDALPRVKEAFENKQEILPRYVLNVGPHASQATINLEHRQLLEKWKPVALSDVPRKAEFGTDVLEAINLAKKALLAHAEFDDFIEEKFLGKKK